jgi:uncharacterized protein (DUF983 family)
MHNITDSAELSTVGVASTAISWLSFMEVVKVSPYTQLIVNILSIIWLSLQIYNFVKTKLINKSIKKRKNANHSSL